MPESNRPVAFIILSIGNRARSRFTHAVLCCQHAKCRLQISLIIPFSFRHAVYKKNISRLIYEEAIASLLYIIFNFVLWCTHTHTQHICGENLILFLVLRSDALNILVFIRSSTSGIKHKVKINSTLFTF